MTDRSYHDRKHLTFEQAEGAEPLPAQLQLKELTKELRARIWHILYNEMCTDIVNDTDYPPYFKGHWLMLLRDKHVFRDHEMVDDFTNRATDLLNEVKWVFSNGDYLKVFGLLQFILRHPACPSELWKSIDAVLKDCKSAYAVFDEDTIVPAGSEAEQTVLRCAFADVTASELKGARAHLREAAYELTAGNYAGSIRESVHSVESVARVLVPDTKTLGPALTALEKAEYIHSALKQGFSRLYGFSSDEEGIRHPLLDEGTAKVDQADALYMLGSCAAFVSYLINKARAAGLLSSK